jgi:hypothetical protein
MQREGKRRPGRPRTEPRFDRLSAEQRAALAAHLQLNRSNLHRYIRISDIMLAADWVEANCRCGSSRG